MKLPRKLGGPLGVLNSQWDWWVGCGKRDLWEGQGVCGRGRGGL